MARKLTARADLTPVPLLPHETLYVGVDIDKLKHVAGFLSRTLLQRHERFEGCPTLTFEQSREGFRALVDRIREYVPLEQVQVLLEHTGHYHRLLEQYLLELDITVYRIYVQKRAVGMLKTDKRDALGLANTLYTQLALGAQVADKMQLVRRAVPPTKAAAQLQGVMRHRYELSHTATQYRNKLTAICDELFPELVQVFHDPNLLTALLLREQFPTPPCYCHRQPRGAARCPYQRVPYRCAIASVAATRQRNDWYQRCGSPARPRVRARLAG